MRVMADAAHHRARLQSGDDEDHALDGVAEELPEEDPLQARRRTDQTGTLPARVKPGRHGGQNARAAEMLRHPKGEERRQDREQDLDHRLVDPPPQAQHHPADADAPQDLADEDGGERSGRFAEREHPEAHRGDGEAIEDERGRIVGERLAFEHDEDAARDLHAARDGERGDGIGRGDDGAEHEAHRPRQVHQPMRRRRDHHRGEDDARRRRAARSGAN